jgi:hypothetical protein
MTAHLTDITALLSKYQVERPQKDDKRQRSLVHVLYVGIMRPIWQ